MGMTVDFCISFGKSFALFGLARNASRHGSSSWKTRLEGRMVTSVNAL